MIIAIHLPVRLGFFTELLSAIGREYPGVMIDYAQVPWRIDVGPTP